MTEPFVAQIQPFAFNFAPKGWAVCQGQTLNITQNTALFSLIGTAYGGDGRVTFGLPNLSGAVVVGTGQGPGLSNYRLADQGGTTEVTLAAGELATHTHNLTATTSRGTANASAGNQLASGASGSGKSGGATLKMYSSSGQVTKSLLPPALSMTGGNGAHNNMQPYLTVNFCIALQGNFPLRP